ncbi:MAG: nucleotidyltransferase domain-containing protein [Candidatus Gastranaerophilaceae bacterium]
MDLSKVIKELNLRIKEKYPDFRGSYLYGSRARGDYREDSDIDIVLVFEKTHSYDEEAEIHSIVADLNCKYDIVIIGIPYTKRQLKKNYVFHNEVVFKGIYYEAA